MKGKRSICFVRCDSSGLRNTSLRRADPYRDEAAEEVDRIDTLSREVPTNEEVPEEKTVPLPPELFDERVP